MSLDIGKNTIVHKWSLTNFYGDVKIGADCRIGAYVDIGPNVVIGDRCIISAFAFIPEGVIIQNNVFVGPRATFCNDKRPPSQGQWHHDPPTIVNDYAVIGANATILPSLSLGTYCFIGAGAVVTKDVPPGEVWVGNPAKAMKGRPPK